MKTQEIELKFRQLGAEKGAVWVLAVHNEKLREMKKSLIEMAKLIDNMSNIVMKSMEAHGATKQYVDKRFSAAGMVENTMMEAERIDDEGPAHQDG